MKVHILGTDHRLQVDDGACTRVQINEFKVFLIDVCRRVSRIMAIAEELSREVLSERHQSRSVCEEIAREVVLTHRYCDPDRATREAHGIREESDLHIDVFMGRLTEAELPAAIRLEHAKRETIWLEEMRILDTWPVLFICGAKHARPFCTLLNASGFESDVIEEAWSPNPPLPLTGPAGG